MSEPVSIFFRYIFIARLRFNTDWDGKPIFFFCCGAVLHHCVRPGKLQTTRPVQERVCTQYRDGRDVYVRIVVSPVPETGRTRRVQKGPRRVRTIDLSDAGQVLHQSPIVQAIRIHDASAIQYANTRNFSHPHHAFPSYAGTVVANTRHALPTFVETVIAF